MSTPTPEPVDPDVKGKKEFTPDPAWKRQWGIGVFGDAIDAIIPGDTANPVDTIASVGPSVKNVNDFISAIANPEFWKRILVGAGGVVLILMGFLIILTNTRIVKNTVNPLVNTGASIATRGVVKKVV